MEEMGQRVVCLPAKLSTVHLTDSATSENPTHIVSDVTSANSNHVATLTTTDILHTKTRKHIVKPHPNLLDIFRKLKRTRVARSLTSQYNKKDKMIKFLSQAHASSLQALMNYNQSGLCREPFHCKRSNSSTVNTLKEKELWNKTEELLCRSSLIAKIVQQFLLRFGVETYVDVTSTIYSVNTMFRHMMEASEAGAFHCKNDDTPKNVSSFDLIDNKVFERLADVSDILEFLTRSFSRSRKDCDKVQRVKTLASQTLMAFRNLNTSLCASNLTYTCAVNPHPTIISSSITEISSFWKFSSASMCYQSNILDVTLQVIERKGVLETNQDEAREISKEVRTLMRHLAELKRITWDEQTCIHYVTSDVQIIHDTFSKDIRKAVRDFNAFLRGFVANISKYETTTCYS